MQLGQWIRQLSARLSAGFAQLLHPSTEGRPRFSWRWAQNWRWPQNWPKPALTPLGIGLASIVAVFAYYILGALWSHKIDDDPNFKGAESFMVEGGSLTISLGASLLDREVNHNGWVANAPFYLPTALLHNMASYQTGIVQAVNGLAQAVNAGLTARGASSEDLTETVNRLRKQPDVWSWALREPLGYLGNSQIDYSDGILDLNGYNVAVADHTSPFPRDGAFLALILLRLARDLEDSARVIEEEAGYRPFLLSRRVGDAFYRTRGIAYCDAIMLKGLRTDYASVIQERRLVPLFDEAESALMKSALFSPLLIVNAAPDSTFLPAHPLTQAYYALAARQALANIAVKLN